MGDCNSTLDTSKDCEDLVHNRIWCKSLENLLGNLHLSEEYRSDFSGVPVWTWNKSNGSSRSYFDRLLVKPADMESTGCPQFKWIGYIDLKFVIYTIDLDRTCRHRLGYWKLNKKSFPAHKSTETRLVN